MTLVRIAILALIQGAAELLPVSSSAHVIVAERLMGLDPARPELTFLLVMLHTGTMIAVLFYFWPRWRPLLFPPRAADRGSAARIARMQFIRAIVIATACTGVLGLGLKLFIEKVVLERMMGHSKGEVEHLFKSLPLIAVALFAIGVIIIAAGSRRTKAAINTVTTRSSIWIGLVQGLCLPFRGFSRSGATISTALFRDVPRALAEDFSFALAVVLTPPVIGLELKRLLEAHDWHGREELGSLLLPGLMGMVFSCLAGLVALRLLSAVLEKGAWKYFGYYCLLAALGVCVVWQLTE
jgi:undecaprenyl-diphosphatase